MNFLFSIATMLLSSYLVTASDLKMNVLRTERELQVGCVRVWQYLLSTGTCRTCPTGKIVNVAGTGCEFCPIGTARGVNGTSSTDCQAATSLCPSNWQYAQYGKCQNCIAGKNSNVLKTGCEFCPPGSIRGDSSGRPLASCAFFCSKWQQALYGKCNDCTNGKVGGYGNVGCQYCIDGTVRGADGTAKSGCVAAADVCLPSQYGFRGKCQTCTLPLVPKDDRTGCMN